MSRSAAAQLGTSFLRKPRPVISIRRGFSQASARRALRSLMAPEVQAAHGSLSAVDRGTAGHEASPDSAGLQMG